MWQLGLRLRVAMVIRDWTLEYFVVSVNRTLMWECGLRKERSLEWSMCFTLSIWKLIDSVSIQWAGKDYTWSRCDQKSVFGLDMQSVNYPLTTPVEQLSKDSDINVLRWMVRFGPESIKLGFSAYMWCLKLSNWEYHPGTSSGYK